MIHVLKTWPHFFEHLLSGKKKFEIRKNDRNFQTGDKLILVEYDNDSKEYSKMVIEAEITYITDFMQKDDYVVLSLVIKNKEGLLK